MAEEIVNPQYPAYSEAIRQELEEKGFVLLGQVLTQKAYETLLSRIEEAGFTESYSPDLHRFAEGDPEAAAETLEAVQEFLASVAGPGISVSEVAVRRYGAGAYTLQHDTQPPAGLHAILFLTQSWQPAFRGEHTFVPEEGDPVLVFPQPNALALLRVEEGTRRFVKRVTHHAEENVCIAVEAVLHPSPDSPQ